MEKISFIQNMVFIKENLEEIVGDLKLTIAVCDNKDTVEISNDILYLRAVDNFGSMVIYSVNIYNTILLNKTSLASDIMTTIVNTIQYKNLNILKNENNNKFVSKVKSLSLLEKEINGTELYYIDTEMYKWYKEKMLEFGIDIDDLGYSKNSILEDVKYIKDNHSKVSINVLVG